MTTILYRTLVLPFYVRNAGTFALVFYGAFGFMRPQDHELFIRLTLDSGFLLAGVVLLWTAYTLRTAGFVRQQLSQPEHLFLQTFRLVTTSTRLWLWAQVFGQLLLPTVGYAGWMAARAAQHGHYVALTILGLANVALLVLGVALAEHRLHHPSPDTRSWLPRRTIRLPYVLFFPTYWLRREPLSLLLTKVLSGVVLLGVCRLYPTDDYDERLLLIGLMLAIITHAQVGRQLSEFEHRYLLVLPNLPLSRWQRLGRYVAIYGLVWLPELLILLRNCPDAVSTHYVAWLWLTGWGWLVLLHTLAYGRTISPDRWQMGTFAGFIGGLLAIMFGLPVGAWLAIGWLGGALRSGTGRWTY